MRLEISYTVGGCIAPSLHAAQIARAVSMLTRRTTVSRAEAVRRTVLSGFLVLSCRPTGQFCLFPLEDKNLRDKTKLLADVHSL